MADSFVCDDPLNLMVLPVVGAGLLLAPTNHPSWSLNMSEFPPEVTIMRVTSMASAEVILPETDEETSV
jgi:hypothetical protein